MMHIHPNVKKLFGAICFLLCLLFHETTKAQKLLDFIARSNSVFVYKLNEAQLDIVLEKRNIPDTPFLFQNLFKKYPFESFKDDTLPNGNYVITTIANETVSYRYLNKVSFQVNTRVIDEQVIFFVQDKKTLEVIRDVEMKLDGKRLHYQDAFGGYTTSISAIPMHKMRSNKLLLAVKVNGEFGKWIYTHNEIGKNNPAYPYHVSQIQSNGYIVTNKPLYKVGDTLQLKSYLLNPFNGKPIRKRVQFHLYEPQQQFNWVKKIKSSGKGAYLLDYKIPDTLKIDRPLFMEMRYKKRSVVCSLAHSVYLEDYRLQENTYDVQLESTLFLDGEDITFFVSAKDANQFPMAGTRISYNLAILQVNEILNDTLTLTAAQRTSWLKHDTIYPNENYIPIKIPWDVLPAIQAKYQLMVTFTDPVSYERKVIIKDFDRQPNKEKEILYQKNDSIFLRCLSAQKDVARMYSMVVMRRQDTLYKKQITTPYSLKLTPFITQVLFTNADSITSKWDVVFDNIAIHQVKGKRKNDSVSFSFQTPFDEPVYYSILQRNKILQSGKSKKILVTFPDATTEPYSLRFTTNINGLISRNFYTITYFSNEHTIRLTNDMPTQAFPGQQIPVIMHAYDHKNKPLRNVNIAAYGVNSQFAERLQMPQIILPEKYTKQMEITQPEEKYLIGLQMTSIMQHYPIQNKHVSKFDLCTNEYYALRYPKDEYTLLQAPIQSADAEFAIVVNHKGMQYSPKYILVDNALVYLSDLQIPIYSFPAKSGKHTIAFRYADKLYTIPNLSLAAGNKYWISMSVDSSKATWTRIQISDSLPALQPTANEKEVLYESILLTDVFPFDTLRIKNVLDKEFRFQYYRNSAPKLMIDGDAFYAFGPLDTKQDCTLQLGKDSFRLQKGLSIVHYFNSLTRDFTEKRNGPPKGIVFHFQETPITNAHLQSLYKSVYIIPQIEKAVVVPKVIEYNQPPVEKEYRQSYRSSQGNGSYMIILQNADKRQHVKSMWIIRKDKPEESDFVPSIPMQAQYYYTKQGAEGLSTIYLLMNNNRLAILENISLANFSHLYIHCQKLKTISLEHHNVKVPLAIYSELTKQPFVPFYNSPEETNEKIIEKQSIQRTGTYLHGLITDASLNPLSNIIVLAEINGRYVAGAKTNVNGLFEFVDIKPGTYQIKLYHPDYIWKHYQPIFLKSGYAYELQTTLELSSRQRPNYEVIQKDFRFLSFLQDKFSNQLHISFYDKDTRLPLQKVNIQMLVRNKEVLRVQSVSTAPTEVSFPQSQVELFQLNMTSDAYLPLTLSNIRFVDGMHYDLQIFLEKKNQYTQEVKKEFDLQMQNVSIQAKEEIVRKFDGNAKYIPLPKASQGNTFGAIEGILKEEANNGIANATIRVLNNGMVLYTIKSSNKGEYKLLQLAKGTYDIKFSKNGFKDIILQEVEIREGFSLVLSVILEKSENNTHNVVSISGSEFKVQNVPPMNYTNMDRVESYTTGSYSATSPASIVSYNLESVDEEIVHRVVTNASKQALQKSLETKYGKAEDKFADSKLIQDWTANQSVQKVRKHFSDVGFWKPNQVTNKNGEATFTIQLPDNITSWKTFWIAMGKNRQHAVDTGFLKVYKPIQTRSILPSFIRDQDKVLVKTTFSNLTAEPVVLKTSIRVNDQTVSEQTKNVQKDFVDSVVIQKQLQDSVYWTAGLRYGDVYNDIEEQSIPILSSALKSYSTRNLLLTKDSTYTLQFALQTKGEIFLANTLYEKIKAEINTLSNYEYGCVEQTASKLLALLSKVSIQKMLNEKENLNRPIQLLINQLNDYQNIDGTWGWWRKDRPNWRMTIYVLQVLYKANFMGYTVPPLQLAIEKVKSEWKNLSISDKIYASYVLQKMNNATNTIALDFTHAEIQSFATIDKVYYYAYKQAIGETIVSTDLYAVFLDMSREANLGYHDNFFYDPRSTILQAWVLFSGSTFASEWLQLFKEKLKNGQLENNSNTYTKAIWIEALCKQMQQTNQAITSTVRINDTIIVNKFPFKMPIHETKYTIQHAGADVFLQTSEEFHAFTPSKVDSIFAVETVFLQDGKATKELHVGELCSMQVNLQAFKTKQHVMLEIPIPAGMYVVQKPQQVGAYTQYKKDKIIVFFEKLAMGKTQLLFTLQAAWKGEFVQAPTQCSLMYYPFVTGNDITKYLRIR